MRFISGPFHPFSENSGICSLTAESRVTGSSPELSDGRPMHRFAVDPVKPAYPEAAWPTAICRSIPPPDTHSMFLNRWKIPHPALLTARPVMVGGLAASYQPIPVHATARLDGKLALVD